MSSAHEPLFLDAVLTPNRSLSPTAFTVVMVVIGAVSFLAGMAFVSMGAFPVLGFFGLDALAIWFAFRLNFRHLRQSTEIRVTPDHIQMRHHAPGQDPVDVKVPTAFATVDLVYPQRRPSELRLAHRGRVWVIGRFLTPGERVDLKSALQDAIRNARAHTYPSETNF